MKAVVFAPHPDDELIGCGGTLLNRAYDLVIVYFTADPLRRGEALSLCAALGARAEFLGAPDRGLRDTNDLRSRVAELLEREKADHLFAPHPREHDTDHRTAAAVVAAARRAVGPAAAAALFGYEVWTPLEAYDVIEDVSGVIERKKQLFSHYRSQVALRPYDEASVALNRYRGIMNGRNSGWCEVFQSQLHMEDV